KTKAPVARRQPSSPARRDEEREEELSRRGLRPGDFREEGEHFDEPEEAAELFRLKRLPEGETEVPVEKYFAAREQMNQMSQYSTAENRLLPSCQALGRQLEL